MKKILMFLVCFCLLYIIANAQRLSETKVSAAAKNAFHKKYPATTGKWESEKENYEVNFRQKEKQMSAVISKKGEIIETETDIAINELPANAKAYLKDHYLKMKIKEAAKIAKANGEVNYEAEVNGKDVIFDSIGKFIQKAKD